jgi:hypothetical protein
MLVSSVPGKPTCWRASGAEQNIVCITRCSSDTWIYVSSDFTDACFEDQGPSAQDPEPA